MSSDVAGTHMESITFHLLLTKIQAVSPRLPILIFQKKTQKYISACQQTCGQAPTKKERNHMDTEIPIHEHTLLNAQLQLYWECRPFASEHFKIAFAD